jgi:hypothetical protein
MMRIFIIFSVFFYSIPFFTFATVSGWESQNEFIIIRNAEDEGREPMSPLEIKDLVDLENYCRDILASDKNIKLIKVSPGVAQINYEYPAKIMGLVPVRAVARAFIDYNDAVEMKLPWYDMFLKKKPDLRLNQKESDLSKLRLDGLEMDIQKQAWSIQLLTNMLKKRSEAYQHPI